MDQQLFQIIVIVFGMLIGIIGFFTRGLIKDMQVAIKDQSKDITELRVDLVRDYVPRGELIDTFNKIFEELKGIRGEMKHLSNNQAAIKGLRAELHGKDTA